mgnify:CR=1 FL=1
MLATGRTSILQSFEILLSLGWIPPIENVFIIVLFLLLYCFSCWSFCRLWRWSSFRLRFYHWKINGMNGTCRALGNTFLAELALCEVDVCHVVLDSDSLERTYLRTLAAADTCSLAGLARNGTLVLVDA